MMTTANEILEVAAEHMRERGKTYDNTEGERSMDRTVAMFNTLTGHFITEAEGWTFMLLLKLVRNAARKTPHQDSLEDAVAYAALMAECQLNGVDE
jgi:hypothetical protein